LTLNGRRDDPHLAASARAVAQLAVCRDQAAAAGLGERQVDSVIGRGIAAQLPHPLAGDATLRGSVYKTSFGGTVLVCGR
jgi:hypothetical protein